MPMQIKKKIKVEVDDSVFYFKPLTMKEAMARQQLIQKLDKGASMIEMAKSVTDLVTGWENVVDEDGKAIPFNQEVLLNDFSVFQSAAHFNGARKCLPSGTFGRKVDF